MATAISQAQLENDVTEWSKTLSAELDDDAKQKAINDYRAETLKKAKQKKAKESAEGKAQAKAAAVPGEAGNLPSAPTVQVPLTVSTNAASSGEKRAALPAGSLKFDDVNHGYYEAVQHDQDAILRHFGKAYASEGIGHCFQRLSWGRRHSGLEFLLDDSF